MIELQQSKRKPSFRVIAVLSLYAFATLQFTRFYVVSTTFYLNMQAYLSGRERLPFQERLLPILLMRPIYYLLAVAHVSAHGKGAFTAERAPFYLISLFALVVAAVFTQKLYSSVSRFCALPLLVYPVFLFTMMWTYIIHVEANFSYPYDMLAVAFFSAGLYFISSRQFIPLLFVMLLGTANRETTLFLIGVYVLDAASPMLERMGSLNRRFSWNQVPWGRVFLLLVVWLAVKLPLAYAFTGNSNVENHARLRENLGSLNPRIWPALLNICGFMLPVVILYRQELRPLRFRNYLWILPIWFAVMFYTGVIAETRIYGELCPYVAVALVLIVESHLHDLNRWCSSHESRPSEPEANNPL